MKSRTVRTCETILKSLIRQYGPFASVTPKLIEKAIIVNAGGDPRTVGRYMKQLVSLGFVKLRKRVRDVKFESVEVYSLNWKKVDYAQLSLQESLLETEEEPP